MLYRSKKRAAFVMLRVYGPRDSFGRSSQVEMETYCTIRLGIDTLPQNIII